jgi:hypothetical protein
MKHHNKIKTIASIAATSMPALAPDATDNAGAEGPLAGLAWRKPPTQNTKGPARALLGLLGHSAECAGLAMAGRIVSCGCRTRPMEDPAVAVGLVMHYARIATTRRLPIPPAVIELLAQRVEEGDPTCVVVAKQLEASGLLDIARKADEESDAAGKRR